MTRRYDYYVPEDPPEIVIAERLDAIAFDIQRIADRMDQPKDPLLRVLKAAREEAEE